MTSTPSHAGGSGPLYPQTPAALAAAEEPVAIPGHSQADEAVPPAEEPADEST